MQMSGTDSDGNKTHMTFELTAKSGHGPLIPCMPAILLAKNFASGKPLPVGAKACVGLITLEDYLGALRPLNIEWETF